jgi:hypothetical protein
MTWQVTWSLIFDLTLSAIIEALVRKSTIAGLLPNDRPNSVATATVLGALLVVLPLARWSAARLVRRTPRPRARFFVIAPFQAASERAPAPGPCSAL